MSDRKDAQLAFQEYLDGLGSLHFHINFSFTLKIPLKKFLQALALQMNYEK